MRLFSAKTELSAKDVTRVYQTLLARTPEFDAGSVKTPAIDFVLSVAESEERRMLQEQTIRKKIAENTGLCIDAADVGYMMTYTSDHVVGEAIRRVGHFEECHVALALQLLSQLGRLSGKAIFLDIGANIGTHTLFALQNGFERAVCIEPDHANFKLLRINQILNEVDHRCTNFLVAASDEDGSVEFELSPTNFGDHRIRLSASAPQSEYDEANRKTRKVETKRLDDLLRTNFISPDDIGLTWLDTQGHEAHVLMGAPSLLAAGVPIVAEFWPYGLTRSGGYSQFRDVVATSGRQIYDLRRYIDEGDSTILGVSELDALFDTLAQGRELKETTHTDLLLV